MLQQSFETVGRETSTIPVRLSYRIIELFSDGLYSSPNKAVEELVSNSFDAGANNVHVVMSPDRTTNDAVIVVVDDGTGMNEQGLKRHWLIGESNKRDLARLPKGRKQIGKFGIGKLATFVLSNHLTHICKSDGKFYAATMDYSKVPTSENGGIYTEEVINLPLRTLTARQAQEAVGDLLSGSKAGYKAIKLFGAEAADTWTVAIMSNLKPMAQEIQKGRLSWVLRTAMPLRDDFKLYLDGDELRPSKESIAPVKKWVIGKELKELAKPAPADEMEPTEDAKAIPLHRYGLSHPTLGRITGYVEVYDRPLTEGKSDLISRSHGFFVYARGRLINTDDELFGLPALRHGTFSRFRAIVHIDKLDEDLRSTRENVRDSAQVKIARDILNAIFNYARNWLKQYEDSADAELKATGKIARSAGSLTRRPLLGLVTRALNKKAEPRFIALPQFQTAAEREGFIEELEERAETDEGLVSEIEYAELDAGRGIAVLDVAAKTLQLNTLHPFVAAHLDGDKDTLSLFAMAEVLTEAYLYEVGLDKKQVIDVMDRRDELLRQFARSLKRTADMVAQSLIDAATDKNRLEQELIAAFDSMGFDAHRIGGSNKPDGKAVANLAADGARERRYSVSLEAKSKEQPGAKVSAKTAGISTVARQRDTYNCEHAVVVGPDFPTAKRGEESALVIEARADHEHTGKTITFVKVHDLAKLVRLVTLKGVGLDRLRHFFQNCITPEESAAWIDNLAREHAAPPPPFELLLNIIWQLQGEVPNEAVHFQAVMTALRIGHSIRKSTEEIAQLCRAIEMLTPWVSVREQSVELTQRPDKVIASARSAFGNFPEDEQKRSMFAKL